MSEEPPLRFIVVGKDGDVIESFTEDELFTAGTNKTWQEAASWARVAWAAESGFHFPETGK